MTHPQKRRPNYPVEPKVKAATGAGAVTAFVLWLLGEFLFNGNVPDPVEALVMFIVPAIVMFVAGWFTRHQYRHNPDLPPPSPGSPSHVPT